MIQTKPVDQIELGQRVDQAAFTASRPASSPPTLGILGSRIAFQSPTKTFKLATFKVILSHLPTKCSRWSGKLGHRLFRRSVMGPNDLYADFPMIFTEAPVSVFWVDGCYNPGLGGWKAQCWENVDWEQRLIGLREVRWGWKQDLSYLKAR